MLLLGQQLCYIVLRHLGKMSQDNFVNTVLCVAEGNKSEFQRFSSPVRPYNELLCRLNFVFIVCVYPESSCATASFPTMFAKGGQIMGLPTRFIRQ